jgi:anti-sigma factor RsiW
MTHQEAVEQMAVEHYLLGELSGAPRDQFEEHLFDCQLCAADLKEGVLFIEGAKLELKAPAKQPVRSIAELPVSRPAARPASRSAWLWRPQLLAPALAACLAVIVYQSAVVVPHMKAEIAEAQAPEVLQPFVLANAGARGGSTPELAVPRHGVYALSVDIPPAASAVGYRCSLYSPAGALVWHVDVTAAQARDAVTIQVPAATAQEGVNELRVQSLTSSSEPENSLAILATYRYKLVFQN